MSICRAAKDLQLQGAQLAESGLLDAAAACFRASLEANPAEPAVHEMLAQVLLELEQPEESKIAALNAIQLNPQVTLNYTFAYYILTYNISLRH